MKLWKSTSLLAAAALMAACGSEPTRAVAPPAATHDVTTSSTLTVTVYGPTEVRPGDICTWEAVVSGGTSPYEYHWSTLWGFGTGYTTESTFTTSFSEVGPELVHVEVRDIHFNTATDGLGINVTKTAPPC